MAFTITLATAQALMELDQHGDCYTYRRGSQQDRPPISLFTMKGLARAGIITIDKYPGGYIGRLRSERYHAWRRDRGAEGFQTWVMELLDPGLIYGVLK